jgi:hypothetical protein
MKIVLIGDVRAFSGMQGGFRPLFLNHNLFMCAQNTDIKAVLMAQNAK